jgi:flagellar FliJ protein
MKKFRFPLRPVAILRAHLEQRAREAFATAVHAYVVAEERLGSIRGHMAELESMLFTERRTCFDAASTATFFRAYRQECSLEMGAERDAIAARAAMQASRAAYLEAHRKVRIVGRLEEKARARHRVEAARAEQSELDELAGHRARHQPIFAP